MKKAMLAALFVILAASWCLAQTDSLPVPAPEPCQPAACSEPCQPGACAVPCQPSICDKQFVPKWAVGIKASSLTNLPGSIILEKAFGFNNTLRLMVSGDYENNGYCYIDRNWKAMAGLLWFHKINMIETDFIKPLIGLGALYEWEKVETQYSSDSRSRCTRRINTYGMTVPFELMHYFTIGKNHFGAGLETYLFEFYLSQDNTNYTDVISGGIYTGYENTGTITSRNTYMFSQPYFVMKYFFK